MAPDSTLITEVTEPRADLPRPQASNLLYTGASNEKSQLPKKTSTSTLLHKRKKKEMRNSDRIIEEEENCQLETQSVTACANILRIIKVVSLLLIGACALLGMVISKLTFVSVTSRMYTLCSHPSAQATVYEDQNKSKIFFQLIFMLVIPEIVCMSYCLLWGFIGKSSKTKPWPSRKAICLVSSHTSKEIVLNYISIVQYYIMVIPPVMQCVK